MKWRRRRKKNVQNYYSNHFNLMLKTKDQKLSLSPRANGTLPRHFRESLTVLAIIVYDKVTLHPRIVHLLCLWQVPCVVLVPPVLRCGGDASRERILPTAAFYGEVLVGRDERSFFPVGLLETATCRPVVGVPDAGKQVHRLLVREEIVVWYLIAVLVHSNRYSIYEEPVICIEINRITYCTSR